MKKYYFSILIQDSDTISEIDTLREKFSGNYDFNICAYMCDMLCGIGFEDDKDNFTDYKPYICKGRDFIVRTYREYTLIRNLAIGGDYMLYVNLPIWVKLGAVRKGCAFFRAEFLHY